MPAWSITKPGLPGSLPVHVVMARTGAGRRTAGGRGPASGARARAAGSACRRRGTGSPGCPTGSGGRARRRSRRGWSWCSPRSCRAGRPPARPRSRWPAARGARCRPPAQASGPGSNPVDFAPLFRRPPQPGPSGGRGSCTPHGTTGAGAPSGGLGSPRRAGGWRTGRWWWPSQDRLPEPRIQRRRVVGPSVQLLDPLMVEPDVAGEQRLVVARGARVGVHQRGTRWSRCTSAAAQAITSQKPAFHARATFLLPTTSDAYTRPHPLGHAKACRRACAVVVLLTDWSGGLSVVGPSESASLLAAGTYALSGLISPDRTRPALSLAAPRERAREVLSSAASQHVRRR